MVKQASYVRAMAFRYIDILCLLTLYVLCCNAIEPSCSSFEFEKKMLENTVRMEYEYKLSNEKVTKELISLLGEKEKFIKEITEAHERKLTDLKSVVTSTTSELLEFKSELSVKAKEMDAVFENQQATIQRLAKDLFVMKNDTIEEIIGKSRSLDISFRASSTTNTIISPGTTIVLPVVSLNHGNGYDPSTGHFTAPVNGTYMFTVRICPQYTNTMVINIVVDENVYSWGHVDDNYENKCYSFSDVIDLVNDGKVVIKCGSGSSSSFSLYHDTTYRQNVFAGYLL